MSVVTRFAPSPTGRLHVGNVRVALLNWLFARQHGGVFILRFDDTDVERSTEAYADGIIEDLSWLGLDWQRIERQSARQARYEAVAAQLREAGRLYPCYETAEALSLKRKIQLQAGKPPLYDRAALALTDADKARFAEQGIIPHWRFKLAHTDITWHDLIRGEAKFHGSNLSDPVLMRANGVPIYSLASTVDDIDMGITHVIRGEDHIANTALQVQLAEALGGNKPTYCHLPLLSGADGEALSKRFGSLSIKDLREQGVAPMALIAHLVRLGSPLPVEALDSIETVLAGFDLSRYSKAAPRYDERELWQVNARYLHGLDFEAVASGLAAIGLGAMDADFWQVIRPNLARLADAADWWRICRAPVTPATEETAYTAQAAALLPDDLRQWQMWIDRIKQETGRKGKALFMPLRLALTGQDHGPELPDILPLIGRERATARLMGQVA